MKQLCVSTSKTPIVGGVTIHACGLPLDHKGPHQCGNMRLTHFQCAHIWNTQPKEDSQMEQCDEDYPDQWERLDWSLFQDPDDLSPKSIKETAKMVAALAKFF